MGAFQFVSVDADHRPGDPAATLQAVGIRIEAAEAALDSSGDHLGIHLACVFLDEVDALLRSVVADEATDAIAARGLSSLRDRLSGHVLAARELEAIEMPDEAVAAVLRLAVAPARSGLARLAYRMAREQALAEGWADTGSPRRR